MTVPQPFGVKLASECGMRTTLGALTELVASAQRHVVIGAPFIQGDGGLLAGPLGMALVACLKKGVRVDVVSTGASLAALDLSKLKAIAGQSLRTYQPRVNVEDPRVLGSHAKFCVCDHEHAYIGSANITQKGIAGHFEMGVLLHGSPVKQVVAFVRALQESGYLIQTSP